jgi:hypothetical protein
MTTMLHLYCVNPRFWGVQIIVLILFEVLVMINICNVFPETTALAVVIGKLAFDAISQDNARKDKAECFSFSTIKRE